MKENHGKHQCPSFWSMRKTFIIPVTFYTFQCPALEMTWNFANLRELCKINGNFGFHDFLFLGRAKPFINVTKSDTFQVNGNSWKLWKSKEINISMLSEHAETLYKTCHILHFPLPGTENHWKSCKSMENMRIPMPCVSGMGNAL